MNPNPKSERIALKNIFLRMNTQQAKDLVDALDAFHDHLLESELFEDADQIQDTAIDFIAQLDSQGITFEEKE